ncbi:hypothetical protein GN956_G23778 [Arapaima gigas]
MLMWETLQQNHCSVCKRSGRILLPSARLSLETVRVRSLSLGLRIKRVSVGESQPRCQEDLKGFYVTVQICSQGVKLQTENNSFVSKSESLIS